MKGCQIHLHPMQPTTFSSTSSSSKVNVHTKVTRKVQKPTNDTKATTTTKELKIMIESIENDMKRQDQESRE